MDDDEKARRKKELKAMRNKQLKKILQQRSVNYSDCLEKGDFINRIMETDGQEKDEKEEEKKSSRERTIAGSKCVVVENADSGYDAAIIICHGYGANEENLADIGDELLKSSSFKSKKIRFIFPRAPIELQQGAYAWWPLDFQALMMKGLTYGIDKVFDGPVPDGTDTALQLMIDLVEATKKETSLSTSQIILGGFSQGSWLMTDVMFDLDEPIGGLIVYSGALFRNKKWTKLAGKCKGVKVLQTHGLMDAMLPLQCGQQLKDFFETNELALDFTTFQGGHCIPPEGIQKMHDMIVAITED